MKKRCRLYDNGDRKPPIFRQTVQHRRQRQGIGIVLPTNIAALDIGSPETSPVLKASRRRALKSAVFSIILAPTTGTMPCGNIAGSFAMCTVRYRDGVGSSRGESVGHGDWRGDEQGLGDTSLPREYRD